VAVAPTLTPVEVGPPPAVDVATLPKPKGPPIAFFLSGRWVKNHRESALYASPDPRAHTFTTLPQWNALLVIETRPDWLKVYFLGDYDGRQPGEAWIPLADTGAVDRPVVWGRALGAGAVWASGEEQAAQRATLSAGALLEMTGAVQGSRVQVRFPGDGQALQPGSGWVDAPVVQPILAPPPSGIPWSYPYTLQDGVLRIPTPYRSQIDGSPWAAANCGPTVVSMALAAFGVNVSSTTLRAEVQDVQKEWGDDNGSYVWALADAVHLHGLKATGLYEGQPQEDHNGPWHQWTADEIRTRLRAGHLVVPQVWWRGLPGREESDYYGDHYIVITGMLGDAFLYNDPVDRDGVGYDRVIRAEQLMAAMQASVAPGAAFAVSR
jgi:hypothetical protein